LARKQKQQEKGLNQKLLIVDYLEEALIPFDPLATLAIPNTAAFVLLRY
jgi:hypothetical protein